MDIGREALWACVPEDRDDQPGRSFGTFTPDLLALAEWLVSCRIETVAREATGVYGIPVDEMLEARGFTGYLVHAQHLKPVPGRTSESQDGPWIQSLHPWGLFSGAFRPEAALCALRASVRHRAMVLE